MAFVRLGIVLLLSFFVGLVLTESAFAQSIGQQLKTQMQDRRSSSSNSLQGVWNLRLAQKRFESPFEQKSTSEFRLGADLSYRPLEITRFRLAPQFSYNTGYQQTQESSEASASEWGVKEASITLEASRFLQASTGALDQSQDHPSILLHDQTFPALRIQLQSDSVRLWSFGLTLESAIPTSSSLSTQTKEFEKTPGFNSASVLLSVNSPSFQSRLRLGAYEFQSLPQSVAQKAGYLGNTTATPNGNSSLFEFDGGYQGTFASFQGETWVHRSLRLSAFAEWVKNSRAADGLNQGIRSEISAELRAGSKLSVIPSYEFFRIDPDATVSSYNGSWLNTNRIGYLAGLGFSFRNKMKISLNGGERDVLFLSPAQQRERTWNLKLETSDAAI
jgi:hypothetical protein